MPGKHLYEYAVIRLVPRVEREEFLNVGIIIFSKDAKYLNCKYRIDTDKLNLFSCELEVDELENNLKAFEKICSGSKDGGPVASWEIPDRFRWLTAQRSSSLQTSRPHNGFSDDLEATLERLFGELVL
ncbi:Protein of unknown function (DUF3037) [Aequorivita sublithincola DSM 14238]|uniref:DUF3037 domain-containing protein n=1 Tax=Aequorivita sublithincola (strain DSM 14238 / LMG 21431 / ACAM 643 / 9-3) TaxID=746697 RepID=I3YWS7_AEQSU|nr:DUF3037 domain-containing protein [Aequorivita sublithincola]AFL81445.1 Protein of unknown function (DUF3037) [Aequorivita sublithincola DSM 14238]